MLLEIAFQENAKDLKSMKEAEAQPYGFADSLHPDQRITGPEDQKIPTQSSESGFFTGAHGFVVKDSAMTKAETINIVTNHIENGKPVFDHLSPYSAPEAAMDSRARYPPPLCHPGTRRGIGVKLETWLNDERRQWKMVWLHGPAGVGKSAVAQTFAEYCANDRRNRLGAAFFFSRSNHRNEPDRVVPTLAYQLAIQSHEYRNLLAHQLVNNPLILDSAMHVQFRKLIVDPVLELQMRGSPNVRYPYVIILDGLDELKGEEFQCEIVELINEAVGRKHLPLLWLVCSRPEPHLKYTFSKPDFTVNCDREELVIDDEAREEVDRYLRDGFEEIRAKFSYTPNEPWPSEVQFAMVSQAASGLFIVASTALKYVGDIVYANPAARLDTFLSFMRNSHSVGAASPLEALDLLYTQILSDVPRDVLPITMRVLSHQLYLPTLVNSLKRVWESSAQALCNFLCLDQSTFYGALRKLHSVIDIPPPEAASEEPLRFYHASFADYLRDPIRSGNFVIEEQKTFVEIVKSCLYWHELDSTLFHTHDPFSDRKPHRFHRHAPLPYLKWVSSDNASEISTYIADFAQGHLWVTCAIVSEYSQDLISQLQNFDFRYIEYPYKGLLAFVNRLHLGSGDSNIIRTKPCNANDEVLLEYLKMMTYPAVVQPATFPISWGSKRENHQSSWLREYFLLGHEMKACIICLTRGFSDQRIDILNSDNPPSKAQLDDYSEWDEWSRILDSREPFQSY